MKDDLDRQPERERARRASAVPETGRKTGAPGSTSVPAQASEAGGRAAGSRLKLLITNFHEGDGGGHTTYVTALARGLRDAHDVVVAAAPSSRLYRTASELPGIRVAPQTFPNGPRDWRRRRQALAQLRCLLATGGFDVVHVSGSADHRLVLAALSAAPRRPAIVLTRHNSKSDRSLGNAWRALRGTDRVIAVCNATADTLREGSYRRRPIDVVHNGVDLAHFQPAASAPPDAAAPLVLGSNAGTAGYKGWQFLVQALALLSPEERAQVRVVIAGRPPTPAQLAPVRALGLQAQVEFPGLLADVRPVVAGFDAGFVLSNRVETISFACREMMAMGKPVLVSRYAGLPENIEEGVDGWIVPPADPPAIAAALREILAGRERLVEMGRAARRHAEADFGLERFAALTVRSYRLAIAERRA